MGWWFSVVEEAEKRFKKWLAGDQAALPPYLRAIVFGIVLNKKDATEKEYEAILDLYKTSQSADGKEIALSVIGDVTNPDLVKRTLDVILSDEIPAQDIHEPCHSLARNPKTRDTWWETMKAHWRCHAPYKSGLTLVLCMDVTH